MNIKRSKEDNDLKDIYGRYPSALELDQFRKNKTKKMKWTREEEQLSTD